MLENALKTTDVFILTGEWQDYKGNNVIRFIGKSNQIGPVEIIINNAKPFCFVDNDSTELNLSVPFIRKDTKLKSFEGKKLDALLFNAQRDLVNSAELLRQKNIQTYETDVSPEKRFLMERFINAQIKVTGEEILNDNIVRFVNPEISPTNVNPVLSVVSVDIETGMKNNILYSIAVYLKEVEKEEKIVFMLGESDKRISDYVLLYDTEKELLNAFINWILSTDPDIIIGWHVIGFDLMYLDNKCRELHIPFNIARAGGKVVLRKNQRSFYAFIPGRVVIDGPQALRSSFFNFEDFKLETVAQELLGRGKIISPDQNKVEQIDNYFKEDKNKLAEYNLEDTVLVSEIFQKTKLIELSVKRSQISGLLMDQLGMMTAAFDHYYLPLIHRFGFAAPSLADLQTSDHAAGGYVLDPIPGIYDNVVVLDFKSLYPSIILTFKIDPVSRLMREVDPVKTPSGHSFSSKHHFLPKLIKQLMEQRQKAKENNDKPLAQAIKILMNSFYGVMGSYGCRFYHPDLPAAITGTGQWLLRESKKYLENKNYVVVYGDTDSLFVKLEKKPKADFHKTGKKLAAELNDYWSIRLKNEFGVTSFLELEYEKYYKKFIITPARGSESGAKKRYAGLLEVNGEEELEFVGMEFVRSDWTRLAKDFQVELYGRIFKGEEIRNWMRSLVQKVFKGQFDKKLVYKKRLRKDVEDYVKNVPQHVKAAKLLENPGNVVYYVITKRGPIPIELKHDDIDYQYYIDKQLKPIADSVLPLIGEAFDSIVQTGQLSFFD